MTITVLLTLIWMHCIADFVFQTDKMAQSKSSSNGWLAFHVLIYSAPFLWFGVPFALATFGFHFFTDGVSSRIAKRLWEKEERHWFFVVIGIDQALHMTALVSTWKMFCEVPL